MLCEGRIVIVTGAGRGIGREHALAFAREGARVVVNDLGVARDGTGADTGPAQRGRRRDRGRAAATRSRTPTTSPTGTARGRLVQTAIDTFGGLDVLVNNAGFLRDRMVFTTSEEEWDAVIRVHLKGHFATDPPRDRVLARAVEGGRSRSTRASSTRRRARASWAASARARTPRPRPASPRSRSSRRPRWAATA